LQRWRNSEYPRDPVYINRERKTATHNFSLLIVFYLTPCATFPDSSPLRGALGLEWVSGRRRRAKKLAHGII
jgi:hypothetical protein